MVSIVILNRIVNTSEFQDYGKKLQILQVKNFCFPLLINKKERKNDPTTRTHTF